MGKVKKWTEEEDAVLVKMYGKSTYAEIVNVLNGRTKKAIEGRLRRLGILGKYSKEYDKLKYKMVNNKKYKKCKTCGKYLPCNDIYFAKDTNLKEGIRNVCKRCKGENYHIARRYNLTDEQKDVILKHYETKPNQFILDELNSTFGTEFTLYNIHKIIEGMRIKGEINTYKEKEVRIFATCYSENAIRGQKRNSERLRASGKWKGSDNPFYRSSRTGDLNPNWDGGKTSLYNELRTQIAEWKKMSMDACNYICVITGEKFDHIHHLYPYKNILDECFLNIGIDMRIAVNDYSKEEFTTIVEEIKRLHDKYGLGVCLSESVHKEFHDIYGYFDNTPEQFYEFAMNNYGVNVKEKLNMKDVK